MVTVLFGSAPRVLPEGIIFDVSRLCMTVRELCNMRAVSDYLTFLEELFE
jgi:hypothetical protein